MPAVKKISVPVSKETSLKTALSAPSAAAASSVAGILGLTESLMASACQCRDGARRCAGSRDKD